MNADSVNAANCTSSQRVEAPRNGRPGRVATDEKLCFEAVLQGADSDGAPDAQSGGSDLGSVALCAKGTPTSVRSALEGAMIPRLGVPAYGSTFGASAVHVRAASASLQGGVPALAAAGRNNQKAGRRADCSERRVWDDGEKWQLLEAMATHLYVTAGDKAQHGAVTIDLKGASLAGTQVKLFRQGHRLSVEIAPASMDAYRVLALSVAALQESMADALPDCFVEVAIVPS